MQFCFFLSALFDSEKMEQIVTEAIERAKKSGTATT